MKKHVFLAFLLVFGCLSTASRVQAMWEFGPGIVFFHKNFIGECAIGACGEALERRYVQTPCGHIMCADCLQEALHRSSLCPVCRTLLPITAEQLSRQFQHEDEAAFEACAGDADMARRLQVELNGEGGGAPMDAPVVYVPVPAQPMPHIEVAVPPAGDPHIEALLNEIAQMLEQLAERGPVQAIINEAASAIMMLELQAALLTAVQMERLATLRDVFTSIS